MIFLLLNLDISILSKITTTVGNVLNSMVALCLLNVSKVMPEAWEKSPLKVSKFVAKMLVVIAISIYALQAVLLGSSLSLPLLLGNIAVVVFAFIFAQVRYGSGKVKCERSYEIE